MSQQSLLENVLTWNSDECREHIGVAVPKLIHYLHSANDLRREAEIIHIICTAFLPVITQDQAESVVFSKVAHKTAECVDSSLNQAQEIVKQRNHDLTQVGEEVCNLFQICMDLVGCLGLCVGHMTPEAGTIPISSIHSLPASVLHVIERSYSHCKKSSQIYGEVIDIVSQQLSTLFRKAHELQTAFINLAGKIEPKNDSLEQDGQDIIIVLHGLFEISQVVASFEVKLMLSLWKAISKISCQHKSVVCNRLDLDMMLSSLAANISTNYLYMFTIPDNEDIDRNTRNKTCKVVAFQMRILQMLLNEFAAYCGPAISDIYRLLVTLKSQMPPCLGIKRLSDQVVEEVERQILIGMQPTISYVASCRDFILAVTQTEDKQIADPLPKLLVLLEVLEALEKVTEDDLSVWIQPQVGNGLFTSIFDVISQCHAEMNLPVILSSKSPDTSLQCVSLYEHVVTKISGFVACLPATHFHALESSLLTNVLSRQVLRGSMAMDVWCFVARYSTPDLRHSHCLLIGHLIHTSSRGATPQYSHLVQLLRRLLRFMSQEEQAVLIQEFPLEAHLELWSTIPLAIFSPSHIQHLVENLFSMSITALDAWKNLEQKTVADCNRAIVGLQTLINVCSSTGVMDNYLTHKDKENLHTCCLKLLTQLVPHIQHHTFPWTYTKCLLKLSTYITPQLDNKSLLEILRIGSSISSSDVPVHVRLSVLTFLTAASKNKIGPSSEQAKVFEELSKLFSTFLSEENPVLNLLALEAFANFAEGTPYESVVTASLENNPSIRERVVGFLREAEDVEGDIVTPIEDLRYQASISEQFLHAHSDSLYPQRSWSMDTSEPIDDMEQYTSSLENLRLGVNALTTLRAKGHLPDWLVDELSVIQMQLSELL